MKKIICTLCLLLISIAAMAHAGVRAVSLPAGVSVYSQFNIGRWQAPVTLTKEESPSPAQAVDAYSIATPDGEYRPALAYRRWPTAKPETLNLYRSSYTYNCPSPCRTYSFTQALAVI